MTWANAYIHGRTIDPMPKASRMRCRMCSCGKRATHYGRANGIVLAWGCELSVRRWVRDGPDPRFKAKVDEL